MKKRKKDVTEHINLPIDAPRTTTVSLDTGLFNKLNPCTLKKNSKPVHNPVFNFMNTVVAQIDMNNFHALALKSQKDVSMKNTVVHAHLTKNHAGNQILRRLDELEQFVFNLCRKGKWDAARAILAEFEAELLRFLYKHFSFNAVKWYVEESVKNGNYLDAQYLQDFGIVYGKIKGKIKIEPELVTDESIREFYNDINFMATLGLNFVTKLKADIHNKRFDNNLCMYTKPILTIDDIFRNSDCRQIALTKLQELGVFDWAENDIKPELMFIQNRKEVGKAGKKGSGLKRMLGAWLDACDMKGLLLDFTDTTRALIVLKFFGLRAEGENDVREMIGKKTKDTNYVELFENW